MAKKAVAKTKDELVQHALKLAATNPKAKWSAAKAGALFNTKEANYQAALDECLAPERPLLKQLKDTGALTPAGFERVAGELTDEQATSTFESLVGDAPEEQVGSLAKTAAGRIPLSERSAFIQRAIGRTPLAAPELLPLLEEVVAAAKAEADAKVAAAAKRKQAHDDAIRALEKAKQLLELSLQNERDAIQRQWAALGGDPTGLSVRAPKPTVPRTGTTPEPQTDDEKDFRRFTADRLAAAWREAWDAKKDEGRDYLETAIWNIRGMKMIGEVGVKVAFDGRRHESDEPVFTDGAAKVVRPGWLLQVDDEEYVALKAAVEKI